MAHLWEDQNELLFKASNSWELDTEAYNEKEGDCQKMPGKKTPKDVYLFFSLKCPILPPSLR